MKPPLFLTLAEVVQIHENQIELYGGTHGVRDLGLLQSALAQPEASFGGEWLHRDLFEMAAAYAFHISENQPFVDGNKRTGLAAALVFLELNRMSVSDPAGKLLAGMLNVAAGRLEKQEFAELLRHLPRN